MNERDYKYDVAFSFLQEDEALAQQLNDLLKVRVKTFIYSERQLDLKGPDGELAFNRVFSEEARIVVVLHRPAWGSTKWTRIEETAIRNRAGEESYDFVTLVPVSKPPSPPKWLPKFHLWVDLERWGVEGAAAVIESRIREAGGTPHQETPEDQAARLSRQMEREQKVRDFLGSVAGVKCAEEEVRALFVETERICTSISAAGGRAKVGVQRQGWQCVIFSYGYRVRVRWENEVSNSLSYSALYLEMAHKGMLDPEWTQLVEESFKFDGSSPDDVGWRQNSADNRRLSTTQMADYSVKLLLGALEEEKPWRNQ